MRRTRLARSRVQDRRKSRGPIAPLRPVGPSETFARPNWSRDFDTANVAGLPPGVMTLALDEVEDCVFATDARGRLTYVNRAFSRTFDYEARAAVGTPASALFRDGGLGSSEPWSPTGTTSERAQVTMLTRTGDERTVSLSVSPLRDASGKVVGALRIAQDLTERLSVERELNDANAELKRSLAVVKELSVRDELTGLFNRRAFDGQLADELARSARHGNPVSLVLLDADYFKAVNDRYGHAVGDQVLQTLARRVQERMRTLDRPARFGGEELAIILPETDAEGAMRAAERIRKAISISPIEVTAPDGTALAIQVTVSIGVASAPQHAKDAAALFHAADQALYAAKAQGRNRSLLAP
jgi:diguanylate cyclase (GGDEF)-like protein/PAS domain S-box-containing protein